MTSSNKSEWHLPELKKYEWSFLSLKLALVFRAYDHHKVDLCTFKGQTIGTIVFEPTMYVL
jgi:hypothetical protein